jgi:hypothetical protein
MPWFVFVHKRSCFCLLDDHQRVELPHVVFRVCPQTFLFLSVFKGLPPNGFLLTGVVFRDLCVLSTVAWCMCGEYPRAGDRVFANTPRDTCLLVLARMYVMNLLYSNFQNRSLGLSRVTC